MLRREALQSGLNGRNAVGPAGGYRPGAIADCIDLTTCAWNAGAFFAVGPGGAELFRVNVPPSFSRSESRCDWTGKTLHYAWDGGGMDVEVRATLPGPIFAPRGREARIRTMAFLRVMDLAAGREVWLGHIDQVQGGRVYLLTRDRTAVLLVASQPLKLQVVTHAFWTFRFPRKGGRLMLVPLLDASDAPRTKKRIDAWLEILHRPPLSCRESYRVAGDALTLRQEFPGAAVAPIPPLLAHLRGGTLMKLPPRPVRLLTGAMGPYEYVRGSAWRARIRLDWTRATIRPTRQVCGALAPLPEELAYAGDVTWDEGEAMDRLLALRTWAPLLKVAPPPVRRKLLLRLAVPEAEAFRRSLETVVEPASGKIWAKEDLLFDYWGDVSYDPDWYNGLSLSGLQRACECGEEVIAAPARRAARELRQTRAQLVAYYALLHCWAYCAAPSDPLGTFWNAECSHNGLEGLLAEAKMRRDEGDTAGADRMVYLAAKTAAALLAQQLAVVWCRESGFVIEDCGGEDFGCDGLQAGRGLTLTTAATKAPYNLANNFPEYVALLKLHGPVATLARQARVWEKEHPDRYRHWIRYYIGRTRDEREKKRQEGRVQAAVFYHLSPEVWLRRFVLDEDAAEIENRFRPRINLAEQLLLRSGMELCYPRKG